MRAISKEPVPYVCEMDRSLPEEEQTVFWVKPKTHQAVNKAMERYGGTFTEDSAGYKTYNVPKLDEADQREWNDVVEKIQNFAFTDKYYADHPEVKEIAKKIKTDEGPILFVELIDTDPMKLEVLRNLQSGVVNEVFRASQDISALKKGEKNG